MTELLAFAIYFLIGFCVALPMRVYWINRNPVDPDLDFNTIAVVIGWLPLIAWWSLVGVAYIIMQTLIIASTPLVKVVQHVDKAAGRFEEPNGEDIGLPVVDDK